MTEERPRPDASMDLLREVRESALDPSYTAATAEQSGRRRRRSVLVPALLVLGLLLGLAVANTWRQAPAAAQERRDLIARIAEAEASIDASRTQVIELNRLLRDERASAGALTSAEQGRLDLLGSLVGTDAVVGPGVRVRLDDGSDASVAGSRVVDTDLRVVVNSLFAVGAEAVSVNGRRLSVRTAIRNAGDAITVDYRSVSSPYLIEAIGDPRSLEERFRAAPGGLWVAGLAEHYGVQYSIATAQDVTVPADPGLGVERARANR